MEPYPEVLQDLSEQIGELLKDLGMEPEPAALVGLKAAEFLREHWGGQKIYIPKGISFAASRRDIEIYGRFNGGNALELCREYGISNTRLYQIIHSVRRLRRPSAPEQPELFKDAVK